MKVISEMTGGFGNQLFAYATAYAVAKENKADLYIDTYMSDNGMTRELGITKLKIEYKDRISYLYKKDFINRAFFNKVRRRFAIGFGTKICKEKGNFIYHPEIMKQEKDVLLIGYWQSDKYFQKYQDELRELFQPQEEYSEAAKELMEIVKQDNTVAVHIRRGDYLDSDLNLTMDYFREAFSRVEKLVENPVYCFFSDDIQWVKENFGEQENFRFISGSREIGYFEEFFVMSACAHQIISNSSFSWWAAYLNSNSNKVVIAPIVSFWRGDFYPESWIKIDSKIMQDVKK